MRKTLVVGAAVLAAVAAAFVYVARDASTDTSAKSASPSDAEVQAERTTRDEGTQLESAAHADAAPQPVRSTSAPLPADPRLAAFAVSPDNGLIEFVVGADGKVIAELDKDPGSRSFKKPLREYTYSGDRVIGLTSYQYFGDRVEVTRTSVSYKPDGSVDQYLESRSER
jgi:hypothetical protein